MSAALPMSTDRRATIYGGGPYTPRQWRRLMRKARHAEARALRGAS